MSPACSLERAGLLRPQAEENQGTRTDLFQKSEKGIEPVNTTAAAAKFAGVSVDTASKYKKVMDSDNDEIKEEVKQVGASPTLRSMKAQTVEIGLSSRAGVSQLLA